MATHEIITIGKVKSEWLKEGVAHYTKLLSKYRDVKVIPAKEAPKAATAAEAIKIESAGIADRFDSSCCNILLDAEGKRKTSEEFARFLQKKEVAGRGVRFAIGGAYGLDANVKGKADQILSLSTMTLPHEVTLVVLLEQLYRAYSILAGSKYHK